MRKSPRTVQASDMTGSRGLKTNAVEVSPRHKHRDGEDDQTETAGDSPGIYTRGKAIEELIGAEIRYLY